MRDDFGEKVAGFILFCLLLLGAAMIAYCGQGIGVEYGNPYLKHHYRLAPGPAVVLLNDLDLTPGVVRTTSRKAICEGGSTDQFRHTTESVKNKAYGLYGIDKHSPVGFFGMEPPKPPLYEIDHLISLELGGADELENLWPQPYYMHPGGAREKDRLENALHAIVCSGKMEPQEAQRCIATDWWQCAVSMKMPFTQTGPPSDASSAGSPNQGLPSISTEVVQLDWPHGAKNAAMPTLHVIEKRTANCSTNDSLNISAATSSKIQCDIDERSGMPILSGDMD